MSSNAFAQLERDENARQESVDRAAELARSSMPPKVTVSVTITWMPVTAEFPDADAVVLVSLDSSEEGGDPVWFGVTDGKDWYDAATGGMFAGRVTHWAELPMGVTP